MFSFVDNLQFFRLFQKFCSFITFMGQKNQAQEKESQISMITKSPPIGILRVFRILIFLELISFFQHELAAKQPEMDSLKLQEIKAEECFSSFHFDSAALFYRLSAEGFLKENDPLKTMKNYRLCSYSLLRASMLDSSLLIGQIAKKINDSVLPGKETKERITELIKIEILFCDIYSRKGDIKRQYDQCLLAERLYFNKRINDAPLLVEIYNRFINYFISLENADSASYYIDKSNTNSLSFADLPATDIADRNFQLGRIKYMRAEYDSALFYFFKVAEKMILYKNGLNIDLFRAYYNIGSTYFEKGEYLTALNYYRKSENIAISIYGREHPYVPEICNSIGMMYIKLGKYDLALDYIFRSLKFAISKYGYDHIFTAYYYTNVGWVYDLLGEYEKSIEFNKRTLSIQLTNYGEYHPDVSLCYYNLAVEYKNLDDYKMALDAALKSLEIRLKIDNQDNNYLATSYTMVGNIYNAMGDYAKAIENFNLSMGILLKVLGTKHIDVANLYEDMGMSYFNKGSIDSALQYFHKAYLIDSILFDDHNQVIAGINAKLGNVYLNKKDYIMALKYYQKAIQSDISDSLNLSIYDNPPIKNILSKPELLNALANKADCLYKLFKDSGSKTHLKSSLDTYNTLFELIQQMRTADNIETSKLLLSNHAKIYFSQAMTAAMDQFRLDPGNDNAATVFNISEKGKGAVMSSYLNELSAKHFSGIPDSLLAEEKFLKTKVDLLKTENQILKSTKSDSLSKKLTSNEKALFRYSYQHDSIITYLENKFPQYYQLKYGQSIATAEQINRSLDEKSALISYFIGDSNLFCIVLSDSLIKLKSEKIDSTFSDLVKNYYKAIKKADADLVASLNHKLYNKLIGPIFSLIRDKPNLVIIPDDYLFYVPFESLYPDGVSSENGSVKQKPNYLLYSHNITYQYSASLWYNSQKQSIVKKSENQNFIGFAPVFDKNTKNGEILVSNKLMFDTTDKEQSYRSISEDMKNFNPLPNTKLEVEGIVKLFNKKGNVATAYLYDQASEDNLKNNLKGYKYVHLATHGFSNDKNPMISGLAFSQPKDPGVIRYDSAQFEYKTKGEDGILYAGEAYNLNMDADLVVLSSCDGGIGKLSKGEGLLAMARGFFYSGTPNIIYSLYKVSDKHTKDLMIDFYTNVLEGKSYSEALRLAKLNLLKNDATSDPFFWSGFVLLGR
jgi:CHAT domain-containing protein